MKAYAGFRHLKNRDFVCSAAGGVTVTIPTPVDVATGQVFSIQAYVKAAVTNVAQNIWVGTSSAGNIQFSINASGQLQLACRTLGTVTSTGLVPRGAWSFVSVTFSANTAKFYLDGELIGTAALAQTFTYSGVNVTMQPGTRISRLDVHAIALTQAQIRAEFYSWAGPVPVMRFKMTEAIGATFTDSIAAVVSSPGTVTWDEDCPMRPSHSARPYGYSLMAKSAGDGSVAAAIAAAGPIPIAAPLLRATTGLTLACWVRVQGLPTASQNILLLPTSDSSKPGPRLRLDVSTGIALQVAGRMTGPLDSSVTAASVQVKDRLLGRWAHVAATVDYAANVVRCYVNGLPALNQTAAMSNANVGGGFTVASGYHPDAISGTETLQVGATGTPITAGLASNVLQTGHLVAPRVCTDAEIRALFLYGTTPTGAAINLTWPEGVGITTTEAIGGDVLTISKDGASNSASWSGNVPN